MNDIEHKAESEERVAKKLSSKELAELHRLLDDPRLHDLRNSLASKPIFNPFEVIGAEEYELRHTRTLRWLLDPCGTHKAGSLFLGAFLEHVEATDVPGTLDIVASYAETVVENGILQLEWGEPPPPADDSGDNGRLDLYLEAGAEQGAFALAIEAKINASEHGTQLSTYMRAVTHRHPTCTNFFYLTKRGRRPAASEDRSWISISWLRDIAEPFSGVVDDVKDDYVRKFVHSYIETLRRICDDPAFGIGNVATQLSSDHAAGVRALIKSANVRLPTEVGIQIQRNHGPLELVKDAAVERRRALVEDVVSFLETEKYQVVETFRRNVGTTQREFAPESWYSQAGKAVPIPELKLNRLMLTYSIEARATDGKFELKLYFPKKDAFGVADFRNRLLANIDLCGPGPVKFEKDPEYEKIWSIREWDVSPRGVAALKAYVIKDLPQVTSYLEVVLSSSSINLLGAVR